MHTARPTWWRAQSVRMACAKVVEALGVVEALAPIRQDAKEGATWRELIVAAQGDANGFTPTKARSAAACAALPSCCHMSSHKGAGLQNVQFTEKMRAALSTRYKKNMWWKQSSDICPSRAGKNGSLRNEACVCCM